jgi:hypothetical protein
MIYPECIEQLGCPGWYKDFLRDDPFKKPVLFDFSYVKNQSESHNLFYEWLTSEVEADYISMVKKQHLVACLGAKHCNPYKIREFKKSATPKEKWFYRDAFPGQLRSDLCALNIVHPFRDFIRFTKHNASILQEEEYFEEIYCKRRRTFYYEKTPGIRGTCPLNTVIEFDNFFYKKEFKFSSDGYFKMAHPQDDCYQYFQEGVKNLALQLKDNILRMRTDPGAKLNIECLATYYHAAINWMPFAHVNNSLLMGQINVILRHVGHESVCHGHLDTLALASSTRNFIPIFKNYVADRQLSPPLANSAGGTT